MLKDVSPSDEFLAAQKAALEQAAIQNLKFLLNHPKVKDDPSTSPYLRTAAEELEEGKPVTFKRIEDLSHLGTSDAIRV